jgi:hydroxyethylthiazole kinase-like uncharacterized protein yjeF
MKFLTPSQLKLKKRSKTSHKGDNGRVLVVSGSIDFVGAAYLAAMAAFRSGVDAVVVAAPEKVAWALNCLSPDLITIKFKGDFFSRKDFRKIVEISKKFDVTLIGNGLGRSNQTLKFASAVCREINGPKVIDADAIVALKLKEVKNAIITPHSAEYSLLMRNNPGGVRKVIGNNIILKKGRFDTIISKSKTVYNKTGNSGMTVGGTGDVLAGLVAGLLAQGNDPLTAACTAAYVNGKAGDVLSKKYGNGFKASELIDELPKLLKKAFK